MKTKKSKKDETIELNEVGMYALEEDRIREQCEQMVSSYFKVPLKSWKERLEDDFYKNLFLLKDSGKDLRWIASLSTVIDHRENPEGLNHFGAILGSLEESESFEQFIEKINSIFKNDEIRSKEKE